jgi:tight adherence protein B
MTVLIVLATTAAALLLGSAWSQQSPRPLHHTSARAADRVAGGKALQPTALIEMVERTSRDVRSGASLRLALLEATRGKPLLLPGLHDHLARGASVGQALAQVGDPLANDAAFVVHGMQLAADTGGAVADTLDRVVAVVRERQAWRAERHAQAAQARLSARMLTVLPLVVAVWAVISGPRVRHAYAHSPATSILAAVGIALNLLGWWWMSRLVRGRSRA